MAGDAAVGAHDAATGVCGRSTHIEVADGCAVVGPAGDRAKEEKLFERKLALENIALREAELALEIERREHLAPDDDVFDVGAYSAMVLMTLSPKASFRSSQVPSASL